MGCLCSKKASKDVRTHSVGLESNASFAHPNVAVPRPVKHDVPEDVYNVLSEEQRFLVEVQGIEEIVTGKNTEGCRSLIRYPPAEDLMARFWIQKRGHVVRTWKKRYCVLDKTELKYFADESPTAPFGKKLKGSIALLGAVCIVKYDEEKSISVEIYGNYGEKDLFFLVEKSEAGMNFVRMLEWAIRKVTVTMLVRNLKAQATGKVETHKKKNIEKQQCLDWLAQQEALFNHAISALKCTQLVQFVSFADDGTVLLCPGLIRLWCVHGDDHVNAHTDANHFGIAYQHIDRDEYEEMRNNAFLEEGRARTIAFADVDDITYQPIDSATTAVIRPKVSAFHTPTSTTENYAIFSIKTHMGFELHLLASCLHDYQNFMVDLQCLVLFLIKQQKMKAATVTTEIAALPAKAAVVTAMKLLSS